MGTFLFNQQTNRDTLTTPDPVLQQPASPEEAPNSLPEAESESKPIDGSVRIPKLCLFQVQVGAFGQKDNAERLAQEFSAQGVPVELIPAGDLTQVRAGLFFGRPQAESFRDRISTDLLQPIVVEKLITARELGYAAPEQDYYQFTLALAESVAQALIAAEEGRLETARAEMSELLKVAKEITISADRKQALTAMLQDVNSNLAEAAKAPAHEKSAAISRGINVFVDWYQRLRSAD